MTTAPDNQSPKPCPACGETEHIYHSRSGNHLVVVRECQECGLSGPHADTPKKADAAWNAMPRRDKLEQFANEIIWYIQDWLTVTPTPRATGGCNHPKWEDFCPICRELDGR